MRKRFTQKLITSVVMSSLIVTPVFAAPQDEVQMLEQQKDQMESQAESVNTELVGLLVEYNALKKDMDTQEKRIDQASDDLTEAEKKEKKQYEDMKLRIKYMYEEGDTSFLEMLATSKTFADLVNKSTYVQTVHSYDRKMLKEYVKTKEEVKELKVNLEAGQAEMQAMAQDMEVQKQTMETTLQTMRAQIENFDVQLAQARIEAEEELKRLEEATQVDISNDAPQTSNPQNNPDQTSKPQAKPDKPSGGNANVGNNNTGGNQNNNNSSNNNNNNNNNNSNNNSGNSGGQAQEEEKPAANPGNAALGQKIANKACQYIGNKYVYGGNSLTNGIDCSGFVQQIHKLFGISTPRSSSALRTGGKAVRYADMLPGDVICYSGHVAIYIGNNTIVHASNSAPYPKGGIKTTTPANYRTVLAVRRYW